MRAVVIHQTGGPEVLRLEDVPAPEPAEGEVLVAVRAVAVNPVEYKQRRGTYAKELPAVLGSDIAGVVEASRAEGFAEGEAVFGFARGGYAELALADSDAIVHKPPGLSDVQAAALPVAALTAWQALFDRAGVRAGQRVLINGAAGGVGHLAVQFAANADAETTGTGSERNEEFVLELGASEFIDYHAREIASAAHEMDVVFDCVGNDGAALVACLKPGGVYVGIAGPPPEREAQAAGARALLHVMRRDPEELAGIAEQVADGVVRIEISATLPLEDVARAHELSESGRTRGKLVLTL